MRDRFCEVLKLIFVMDVSIRKPTMISAGAVAKDGIARKIGDRNRERPNKRAAVRLVSPVRPPSATPEALSTKVVVVEVPRTAPAAVPTASAMRAPLIFGSFPFSSSMPICCPSPRAVASVPKKSLTKKASTKANVLRSQSSQHICFKSNIAQGCNTSRCEYG